ncbi:MAG TPA: non-canonical purine NTP pyrophosphatase [Patescibacteria group bacterium]|jgi:XTP/dITP diphosphohydrolase|nr:non-canonical purine NTP pyrophosphatase [Patescibacteria group bacterium]
MKPQNRLLIATKNQGKVGEFKEFLKDLPFEIVSLQDLNITEDIEEDGKTYQENSQKKALFFAKLSNLPTVADDGGIEIVALNNEPGVRTRRWLGHHMSDEEIISHMLKISKELPDNNRKALFKAIVTLALPNGKCWSVSGEVEGEISKTPKISFMKGYPFRSFFYLPKINKFYYEGELSKEEERLYNHRYKAVQKLLPIIQKHA